MKLSELINRNLKSTDDNEMDELQKALLTIGAGPEREMTKADILLFQRQVNSNIDVCLAVIKYVIAKGGMSAEELKGIIPSTMEDF